MRTRMMAAAERWGAFAPMVEPLLWLGLAVIPLLGGCQLHLHLGEKHVHEAPRTPQVSEAESGPAAGNEDPIVITLPERN